MVKTFSILAKKCSSTHIVKKSRFIALLTPLNNVKDVQGLLISCKKDYPSANHYCWAYFITRPNQPNQIGSSDDGEPVGTAGKPMAHVLVQNELSHCLAIVVRYFGGVKLGAGGLARAYSQATAEAIKNANIKIIEPKQALTVCMGFQYESSIRRIIMAEHGVILNAIYQHCVTLHAEVLLTSTQDIIEHIQNATQGRADVTLLDG